MKYERSFPASSIDFVIALNTKGYVRSHRVTYIGSMSSHYDEVGWMTEIVYEWRRQRRDVGDVDKRISVPVIRISV